METLNQDELKPWKIQHQVAAIYSGTGGYLDRIKTDRVAEFHESLLQRLDAEESDLMEKIADGNWDDDIEEKLGEAIRDAIDDFGPDFDEEGNELEEGESDRVKDEEEREKEGRTSGSSDSTTTTTPTRTTRRTTRTRTTPRPSPTTFGRGRLRRGRRLQGRREGQGRELPAWPPRRTPRAASPRSRTSRRSRGPWRWSRRLGCAGPSSASRRCAPTPTPSAA